VIGSQIACSPVLSMVIFAAIDSPRIAVRDQA
jgi:hypothetical protein